MTTIEQLQALRSHREDRAYTSVYGDALKRRQDMDICNLFYGNEAATQAFLRTILNAPSFSLELQTDEPSGEPIKQLYFEADARYRLGGEHQLGFGYPMLIRRDERSPNGYIAAPIFIWHLQLVASPTKPNLYTLVRTLHQDVEVNPLLLHYLENVSEQNLRTALEPELLAACAGNRLKDQRMLAVCNALSIALGMVSHSTPYNIVPIPAPATALTEEGRIVFAGVLGMFEPYHASSDELLKQLTAPAQFASPVLFENDVLPTLGNHPYTDTQLDAYQEEVLRAIHATRDVCVVAPANTDKIGLLRGIAANALANGARCLIVSPNTALLQAVETHAKDKGYGQLALRLQDGRYEKNNFLLQLQAATLSIKTPIPFRGDEFQLLINNTQRQETHLGETYAMLRERMFGNNNRSETVGLFLEQHFRESKHLLTGKLDPSTWVFTEDTYHLALTHVLTARRLYEPLGTLTHPLEQLHPSLFAAGTDSATAGDRFHTVVEEKLRRARQIEQSHDRVLEDYESLLEADFTARHLSLYRAADDLAHALANYTTEYGADFDRHDWAKRTQLSVAAMFDAKPRSVIEAKAETRHRYEVLVKEHNTNPLFIYRFTPLKKLTTATAMRAELSAYLETLEMWKTRLADELRAEVLSLSSRTIYAQIDIHPRTTFAESEYTDFIESLNASNILLTPINTPAATIAKQREVLDGVALKLEELLRSGRDFETFYEWQSFWLPLPATSKDVIQVLIQTQPNDWEAAFSSWFLFHALQTSRPEKLSVDDNELTNYEEHLQEIAELIPKRITSGWQVRQNEEARRVKKENRRLWADLTNTKDNSSLHSRTLAELLALDWDFTSTLFPLCLTSPQVATEYLPELRAAFDIVIIDQADTLPAPQLYGALWRSTRRVLLGQDLSSADRLTLWEFGKKTGFAATELRELSANIATPISDISNALFHGHRLSGVPNPPNAPTTAPLRLVQVNGIYYGEHRTNEDEAQELIRLLNAVEPNLYGVYPSIGIVCFTHEQRTLIGDYLLKIKQEKSSGYERIQGMEKGGMGIYHVSEITDVRRDVLFVSITYGLDIRERLTTDINELHSPEGYAALRALAAMPLERVFVCTSVPISFRKEQLARGGNDGVKLLAAYLSYIEAVDDDAPAQLREALEVVTPFPQPSSLAVAPSFNEQVRHELSRYIAPERIRTNVFTGSILLDLVVLPEAAPARPVALITDGFFRRGTETGFAREARMKTALYNAGYDYYPLRTTDWWRQPSLEAKRIAGIILAGND